MAGNNSNLGFDAGPGPMEQRVNALYNMASMSQQRAESLTATWMSWSGAAAGFGLQAYNAAKDASKAMLSAAKIQANMYQIAAAQAGISASGIYEVQQQQIARDESIANQRIGSQKTSYAGQGISLQSGSPSFLIAETIDQSLAQQKSNFMTAALQEQSLRQQQQNSMQQANITLQAAAQQSNTNLTKGYASLVQSTLG